jgi:threonine aldolase
MHPIDLRSDTVTQPTPAMRAAMSAAVVGDDVYGEDPTVNRLEAYAAAKLDKEATLFVPSGTMGNLAAVLSHCQRGDEVIVGALSHTFLYEAGGISVLGGVHSHQLPNEPDGTLSLERIKQAIRRDDVHFPVSRLVVLENTHNRCAGSAISVAYTHAVATLAHDHGLMLHIDGARIFNAAAALGVTASALAAPADSITFCLSKGLCAPVGSLLCGSQAFVERARRIRKQLGGGMRQAGILAAAGLIALETMTTRLQEDHDRAYRLANALSAVPGLDLDAGLPATNLLYVSLTTEVPLDAAQIAAALKARGVLVGVVGSRRFRLVTHYWIDDQAVDRAVQTFEAVLAEGKPA